MLRDVMSKEAKCCDCNTDIAEVSKIMGQEQVRRIPVTENGKLVGILTLGDMARNQQINNEFVGKTARLNITSNNKITLIIMQKEKSLINRPFNNNIEPKQNAATNKILDLVG